MLGLGGPTGVAMSPARDMGPRLAHWVLPIRGKGSSEFLSYSCALLTAFLAWLLTSPSDMASLLSKRVLRHDY